MKEALLGLLEVRKLISLGITILFITLALQGKIDTKLVEYVTTTVIAFYFAKSTALDVPVVAVVPVVSVEATTKEE